jgi:hypothetical protein
MKKKIIITQLLYNIKKIYINLFSLYSMKTKSIRKKKKNSREKKIKLEISENIF